MCFAHSLFLASDFRLMSLHLPSFQIFIIIRTLLDHDNILLFRGKMEINYVNVFCARNEREIFQIFFHESMPFPILVHL